ncbi:hypothetical protein [Saccharothrix sp. NRRL B-16314]|uniref:hypothetical protein n=1 Tax=Saccharothrix sp. NRRL B-16314 TaxID=1463825 RepID=UPI0005264E73|nr:hypothetical protein [Saccharothrix sp. NRRL B-16314]
MRTIPVSPLIPQDASSQDASSLAMIVVAVLDFFRPTIFGSSWTPWLRAMFAIMVLAAAIVAVALSVQLT